MSARWRGTLVYVGSLVVIGAAAFAKYGGVLGQDAQGATTAFASAPGSTTASPEPSADPSQRARPKATDKSGTTDRTTDKVTTEATDKATDRETAAPTPEPEEEVVVTGVVASSVKGPVQVAVTFEGDRIVDVITIQAGEDHPESTRINEEALPILRQEALDAQSAQIDTVSGATYTSEGYRTSLQSAIDQHG